MVRQTIFNTTATGTLTIYQKNLIATVTANDKIYDGNTAATGTIGLTGIVEDDEVTASGTFTFENASVGEDKTVNVTGIVLEGVKAGNYILNATNLTSTANIAKRTLTLGNIVIEDKIYDGTIDAIVTGGTLEGSITAGDDVTLNVSTLVAQFEDKNVGTDKKVTVSGYVLEGADALNYDLLQPNLTADIQKRNIDVSNIVISDKVYDGSTTAAIESIALSWKAAEDDVYARIPVATALYSDTNIGNSKIVSVTGLELGGADAGNYLLTSTTASTTGNILPTGTVAVPSASPTEEIILSGTNVTLTTSTNEATIYYTLDGSMPTVSSDMYNGSISIAGDPGTIVTVKAIAVKTGMIDSGIIIKQYTIAEPGSLLITAVPDNQMVKLSWNWVPDTVSYAVYVGDNYLGDGISVTDSVYEYNAVGLTNGNLYIFTVNAIDCEQRVANTAQVSAIPMTVPTAPNDVTATAGNGQAVISFTAPNDNGGSEITEYIVTSSPGNITATGNDTTIKVTGLSNGTNYTFTVKAANAAGTGPASIATNTVTPYKPSGGSNTPSTPTISTQPVNTGVDIIINGKTESAATVTTTQEGDQTVTTVVLDDKKVEEKLLAEGNNANVTIPVKNDADVVIGQLNGQTVKNMEAKEAVLEIKTENVTYKLPTSQINIDNVSEQIGKQVELKDIKVNVTISAPQQNIVKIVENTANKNNYQVIVKPVEFNITCSNGGKTIEVSRFNSYVERMVAIPDGIDPSKINTGIVLNADGTFSHVPTQITVIDGKYYAKINSLTNSIYSVICNPVTVKSVENHWAKNAVNDMASRLVIFDPESFAPDKAITRADFAKYIIRALGLYREGSTNVNKFKDVSATGDRTLAIHIVSEYGIVTGYTDGTFKPDALITREEAMTMYQRAMKVTKLTGSDMSRYQNYTDFVKVSDWATSYVKDVLAAHGFNGTSATTISPKANLTYAEAAQAIKNLLVESKLINK